MAIHSLLTDWGRHWYADTDNEIITTNVLSEDKTKILSSTVEYDDKSIITEYSYSTNFPGNIIFETVSEFKNENSTILSSTEYSYDITGTFVTRSDLENITTHNTNFIVENVGVISSEQTYDNMGRVNSKTDTYGNTTEYTYNKNGWITRIDNPDGTFVTNTYSISGGTNKVTTSYNNKYYYIQYYDGMGNVIKEAEKAPGVSEKILKTYSYNEGKLWDETDSLGNITSYFYDEYDRLYITDVYNPVLDAETGSWTKSYGYDDFNLTKSENIYESVGKKTTYYDIAGRIIKEEQNTSAGLNFVTYEYDHMGNVIKTTDAKGNITSNIYNDMGQLVSVTDALENETSYEYDSWGNIAKTTYNQKTVSMNQYDNAGRLIKTTDALGNSEYYAYDYLGQLVSHKDKKGQITTNSYDIMGRLTRTQNGTNEICYTYDSLGNQLTMTDSTGTTSYDYTYNNRVSQITTPDEKTISYTYDLVGNITSMTDYEGNVYDYTYEHLYRTNTIKKDNVEIVDYDYCNNGCGDGIETITYPEGTVYYTYDNAMRVTAETSIMSSGEAISVRHYTYDINGNMIEMYDELWEPSEEISYTYDAINRLTSETQRDGTVTSYTFDNQNNIATKSITHPSSAEFSFAQSGTNRVISGLTNHSLTYTYNNLNQLTAISESVTGTGENFSGTITKNIAFTYDANGNTLSKRTYGQVEEDLVVYTYNALNQLIAYEDLDGTVVSYAYDGTGMRVSKTQGTNVQRFYWDRGYIVNESLNGTFTVSNSIGMQGIFARTTGSGENSQTNFLFKNAHGDVTDIVSDDEVTNEYEYDAYGNQKNISASDTNPFRYCGEYYDEESGLIYLRNRYYDPEIERFITEDPIQDGMNWYAYCGNNPVMFVDNSGLDAVVITSDNAAGSSGIYAGHTSVIVQDKNGDWYYYYWGDEAAYLEKVSDNVMRSFASFNNWLSKEIDIGDLKNSTNNYTAATYIKGDFSKSYDYFYNLVKNADVGTKQKFGGPIVGYVEQSGNFDYSLFSKNCVTTSIEGLHKGTLSNGKSYGEVLPYRTIIPKLYKNAVRKVFGNSSFTEVK